MPRLLKKIPMSIRVFLSLLLLILIFSVGYLIIHMSSEVFLQYYYMGIVIGKLGLGVILSCFIIWTVIVGTRDIKEKLTEELNADLEKSINIEKQNNKRVVADLKEVHGAEVEFFNRTRNLFNSTPMIIEVWGEHMMCMDVNEYALKMYNLEKVQDYNESVYRAMPLTQPSGESSVSLWMRNLNLISDNNYAEFEFVRRKKNGENIYTVVFGVKMELNDMSVVVTYSQDVTQLRRSQAMAKEAVARTLLMFDATPVIIELWDRDLALADVNPYAMALFGAADKMEYSWKCMGYMPEVQPTGSNSAAFFKEQLSLVFVEGYTSFEMVRLNTEGELVYTEVVGIRMSFEDRDVVVTYSSDVSQAKQMQEEREKAIIAEENSKAKSRFLARMSHEIRTPIAAVLGVAEIQMQNSSLSLEVEEAFVAILRSGQTLLALVNDILDLSKIEAGKMELICKPYDVAQMVSAVSQINLVHVHDKAINFIVDIDENVPASLEGDELRIRQVLNNLVSNALKYTDKGTVHLSMYASIGDVGERVNLIVYIKDTGRGMSPKQKSILFDEYTRFHEREISYMEGTGLGMPITLSLLDLMKATIEVESAVDSGTGISIILPQKAVGGAILGRETVESLKNFEMDSMMPSREMSVKPEPMPYGNVLVVDDVDTNLYVAKGLLGRYKLNVETVNSGLIAIEKIKQGEMYDIIFMDQMMPEMDGIEVTQTLRGMGYENPIVALTANALMGQAEAFIKNGFDGFLSKPIQTLHLNAVLNKFVRDRHPEASATAELEVETVPEEDFDNYLLIPEIAEKIREDFMATQANVLGDIVIAMNEDDMRTAHRIAHSLKGFAGLLGDDALTSAAVKLERVFKAGDIPEAEDLVTLDNEIKRVIDSFQTS